MTEREAAVIMAVTGITTLAGDKLEVFYDYVKELLGRPVMTHELPELADEIKHRASTEFFEICEKIGPEKHDVPAPVRVHKLKLNIDFYDDVMNGLKTFEIRNDDRNFQVGDFIVFTPFAQSIELPDPDVHIFRITYKIGWTQFAGLKEGYAVLGIEKVKEAKPNENLCDNGSDEKV
ncbi:MAG: DUF3850 domain-containing protein [Ruminococcus sp.]|nr:DUF3850 domain-containing protein [Ruminococcus sp.]